MLKDPNLKSAFYEQPTLWQLFVAELTGKETKGRGIIAVTDIVKKYDDDKYSKELGAKFIKDKLIFFYPMDKIVLKGSVNGKEKQVELMRGSKQSYKTIVLGKKLAEGPKLRGSLEGINYVLEIKHKLRDELHGYMCYVTILNQDGSETKPVEKRVVLIKDRKSEGFQPNQSNVN